jgi:4-hydroxyproline epimerase
MSAGPDRPHTFFCIDGHTCGNPVRLVAGGGPRLEGRTMSERRQDFLANHDWVRRALMFEPRGHDMMSGAILYPPLADGCDVGVLFIETSGCLPMCGHGAIGTVTAALEHGLVAPRDETRVLLDTPAGVVAAEVRRDGRYVAEVRITNVLSFLAASEIRVECPELGELVLDVAYGGNFYAIVEPQANYRDMADLGAGTILRLSPELRRRVNAAIEVVHPDDPTIRGVSHVMWTGTPTRSEAHARNAVFYGDHAIDRSPCGTGTSARMAQLAAKGRLEVGDDFVHESIIGSLFRGRVEATGTVGNRPAIRPSVAGWARVTGHNTILVDPRDPFATGFQVA